MELKIDSEKVLKLAEKCPQWKDGLRELFPEVFTPKKKLPDFSQFTLHLTEEGELTINYLGNVIIRINEAGIHRTDVFGQSIRNVGIATEGDGKIFLSDYCSRVPPKRR